MKIVNAVEFKETIETNPTVLVDFYADWCGPCKMAAPALEAIAKANPALTVVKVNVDQDPAVAQAYGIMSIPNFIVFKDGKAVDQSVGFKGKPALEAFVKKYL